MEKKHRRYDRGMKVVFLSLFVFCLVIGAVLTASLLPKTLPAEDTIRYLEHWTLTDEEYKIIRQHPVMGAKILKNIQEKPELFMGARWHHERFDGGGYPDGIAGEEIPEKARIIAAADAYDAMTSYRSYREPMPQTTVSEEIQKGSGTQFDARFADIMLQMIAEDTGYEMRETK